ncbi:hypothetical protein GGR56DRAFT_695416 [Xylariaceae sp. FL0804]|nr:hypothetical protein GGR56DRAFT_695416 [Xylariaceae sp. FL0804]
MPSSLFRLEGASDTPAGRALAAEHEICRAIQHPYYRLYGDLAPVMSEAEFASLRDGHAAARLRPWRDRVRDYPAYVAREQAREAQRRADWRRRKAEWRERLAAAPPEDIAEGRWVCGHGQPRVFACAECALLLREPRPPRPPEDGYQYDDEDEDEDEKEEEDGNGDGDGVPWRWRQGPRRWERARARLGRAFHGFLALPAEVRHLVYEQALVVGRYYVPVNESWLPSQPPYYLREDDGGPRGKPYVLLPGHVVSANRVVRARYADWFRNGCGWHDLNPVHPTRFSDHDEDKNPFTAGLLMGVCKEVQAEATHIFLGRNQFVFPCRGNSIGPGARYYSEPGAHEWHDVLGRGPRLRARLEARLALLRDVSIAFDYEDVGDPWNFRGSGRPVARASIPRFHDYTRGRLLGAWERRLLPLQRHAALRRLQVDVEDVHWVSCCRPRLLRALFRWLLCARGRWHQKVPDVLDVVGWRDEAELEALRRMLLLPVPQTTTTTTDDAEELGSERWDGESEEEDEDVEDEELAVPEQVVFAPESPRMTWHFSHAELREMQRPQTKVVFRWGSRTLAEVEEDYGTMVMADGMPSSTSSVLGSGEHEGLMCYSTDEERRRTTGPGGERATSERRGRRR